jgi:hypothetical protein
MDSLLGTKFLVSLLSTCRKCVILIATRDDGGNSKASFCTLFGTSHTDAAIPHMSLGVKLCRYAVILFCYIILPYLGNGMLCMYTCFVKPQCSS